MEERKRAVGCSVLYSLHATAHLHTCTLALHARTSARQARHGSTNRSEIDLTVPLISFRLGADVSRPRMSGLMSSA